MSPMSSFRIGRGIGLVGETTLAVLEPMNAELAQRLWQLVVSGAGIDELLEELSTTGLRTLGSFAMAQFEDDAVRIVVRGDAGASVGGAGGERHVVARGVRTWHEEVVEGAGAVQLFLGPPVDAVLSFRVVAGLVPTDGLRRDPDELFELRPGDVDPVTEVSAADVFVEAIQLNPRGAAPVTPAEPVAPDPATTRMVDEYLLGPGTLNSPPSPRVEGRESDAVPGAVDAGVDDYDQIWGRTIARSVQAAAVHQAAAEHELPEQPPPGAVVPAVPADAPQPLAGGSSPLIQAVPGAPSGGGMVPPAPLPVSAVDAPSALGDHDGRTMTKAQIRAMKAAAAGGTADAVADGPSGLAMGGPTVQALLCPSHHANPPQASRCRVCGQALSTPPVVIARPTLGSLRFSNGTTVVLDRPALIGRNPKLEGAMPSEVPTTVRLDVGQGLSRTHASVRLEGWQVLLEDLNSPNGTIVQLPGREARRLHPGEPVLLEHGATIDFGGEVTCVVDLA
jgi:hypothetical protein